MASIPEDPLIPQPPVERSRPLSVQEAKARLLDATPHPWIPTLSPLLRTAARQTATHLVARFVARTWAAPPMRQPPATPPVLRTAEETRARNVRRKLAAASRRKAVELCILACEVGLRAWSNRRKSPPPESPTPAPATEVASPVVATREDPGPPGQHADLI